MINLLSQVHQNKSQDKAERCRVDDLVTFFSARLVAGTLPSFLKVRGAAAPLPCFFKRAFITQLQLF